ncbi:MAG: hypothetical protein R3C01_12570 [Planctomycetaceae bacterium]
MAKPVSSNTPSGSRKSGRAAPPEEDVAESSATVDETPSESGDASQPKVKAKRGVISRMIRLILTLSVLLLIVVVAAPTIVSQTGLKNVLPRLLVPQLPEGCTIGDAQLGWMTPVVLRKVHLPDRQGGELLDIETLTMNRTLWQLINVPHDLGKITIAQPRLRVVVRADGTNLGDVLNRFPASSSTESPDSWYEVIDADVRLEDPAGFKLTSATVKQGTFRTSSTAETAWSVDATAQVTHPTTTGTLRLQGAFEKVTRPDFPIGPGNLRVDFVGLPLDALKPVFEPLLQGQAFAGHVTGSLATEWREGGASAPQAACLLVLQEGEVAVLSPEAGASPKSWRTGPASIALEGMYDPEQDLLTLTRSAIESTWISGQLSGTVSRCRGECYCMIGGGARVDLDPLWQLFGLGDRNEIEITGLETRRVALRGPLRPGTVVVPSSSEPGPAGSGTATGANVSADGAVAGLPVQTVGGTTGTGGNVRLANAAATSSTESGTGANVVPDFLQLAAEVAWKQVRAYGVESQDAVITVNMTQGKFLLSPTHVPVSGGRLVSDVKLITAESPLAIEVPPGMVLEQVAITEPMCRTWMKYLSPMLADTARVEGKFSLQLQEGDWQDPQFALRTKGFSAVGRSVTVGGRCAGTLQIHEAIVGPGPLIQGPLGMISQVQTILRRGNGVLGNQMVTIQEQEIPFEVRDNRVYHSRFALKAGEVTFFSSGSVGFDETLDLLVEVQVPETWFENRPLLASARGQLLAIPIHGTFTKPEVDGRAFGQFAQSFGIDAATNAAGNLIERLIDRRKERLK